jgi:hypothetical protein
VPVEIPGGLNSQLAHTAALWRKACEPVAGWLAQSFNRASDLAEMRAYAQPLSNVTVEFPPPAGRLSRAKPASQHGTRPVIPPLAPPLGAFISSARGHRPPALSALSQRGGLRDDLVPRMCWECGRALPVRRRAFCSDGCAENYRWAMGKRRPIVTAITRASYDRHREATLASQRAAHMLPAPDRDALRSWYQKELQPRVSKMSASEVVRGAAMGRTYAYHIIAGTRIPHPRHYPNLAALAGVELPGKFAAEIKKLNSRNRSQKRSFLRDAGGLGHVAFRADQAHFLE